MRKASLVLILGLLLGARAGAQTTSNSVPFSNSSMPMRFAAATAPSAFAGYFAGANSSPSLSPSRPLVTAFVAPSEPADPPQGVQGVFQTYTWDAYIGYAFVRFYEVPGTVVNRNGFEYSMTYFFKDWIGGEGEFTFGHGSVGGQGSRFVTGMGGLHARLPGPRGIELWAHGLAGGAEFSPQTAYGGQKAFAGELGGGVDISSGHRRLAYRIAADMVATRFFSTYQISPKVTAGIVFRF